MLKSTVTLLVLFISLWNIHVLAVSTYDEFAKVGSPERVSAVPAHTLELPWCSPVDLSHDVQEFHEPNYTSIAARLSRNILYHPKRVVWLSESSRRKQQRQVGGLPNTS
jgi:hypothetical protein